MSTTDWMRIGLETREDKSLRGRVVNELAGELFWFEHNQQMMGPLNRGLTNEVARRLRRAATEIEKMADAMACGHERTARGEWVAGSVFTSIYPVCADDNPTLKTCVDCLTVFGEPSAA